MNAPTPLTKPKAVEVPTVAAIAFAAEISNEKPSTTAEKKTKKVKEKKQKSTAPSTTTSTIRTAQLSQTEPAKVFSVPNVTSPPAQPLPDVATATIQKEKNKNEAWYLRTVAAQYANDLDKLRTAPDFKGKESVEVLRWAMRLGVECLDV